MKENRIKRFNEKLYTMEEQKLRQLFKNRSNCYVDTDDVVQGMDENCFVETVNEALRLHDVSRRSEQFKCGKCNSNWGEVRATCFNCGHDSEDLST